VCLYQGVILGEVYMRYFFPKDVYHALTAKHIEQDVS